MQPHDLHSTRCTFIRRIVSLWPFEVNVPELSNKLYYGLVNTMNTQSSGNNIHFVQQAGDVAANTPFLFKIGVKKNWDDASNSSMYASEKQAPAAGVDPAVRMKGSFVASQHFDGVTIADGTDFSYNDNATAPFAATTDGTTKLVGVYNDYTTTDGDWLLGVDGVFHGGEANVGKSVKAISAYVSRSVASDAAPRFFFDEDGTTTAIEGVFDAAADAEYDGEAAGEAKFAEGWYTITGVKLEAEPTVSGTYIYNGKKVYIKK